MIAIKIKMKNGCKYSNALSEIIKFILMVWAGIKKRIYMIILSQLRIPSW